MTDRLVVAITGASGIIYGVRTLQMLSRVESIEAHLVISNGARLTLGQELDMTVREVSALADVTYNDRDLGAALSSGSFKTGGMVVAPCSIKALSGIANSYADSLIVRAADVTLKERRRLVLMVRESPLHVGHLRLMSMVAEAGAIICPPVPAFYSRPQSISDIVDHTVGRVLDLFDIESPSVHRWTGLRPVTDRGGLSL